jgi:acetylglutamate kinase
MDPAAGAQILTEALPYIKKFQGKTIVVKYGGNAMVNEELKAAVMQDLVLLQSVGVNVVLVHGGGPEITDLLNRLGMESKFIGGLRYTDAETARIVQMVLAGKVNKDLVVSINRCGGKAVGICGLDGGLLLAKKQEGPVDLGFVGDVEKVNCELIKMTLDNGFLPVIATVGADEEGNVYNINADTAASAIASALSAVKLILLTDVRGLLRDKNDENSLISSVAISQVPALIRQGIISGGMTPKIQCCVEGVRRGVGEAVIIDGRIKHSILLELFSDTGIGTLFYN